MWCLDLSLFIALQADTKASPSSVVPSVTMLTVDLNLVSSSKFKVLFDFLRCFPNVETWHPACGGDMYSDIPQANSVIWHLHHRSLALSFFNWNACPVLSPVTKASIPTGLQHDRGVLWESLSHWMFPVTHQEGVSQWVPWWSKWDHFFAASPREHRLCRHEYLWSVMKNLFWWIMLVTWTS